MAHPRTIAKLEARIHERAAHCLEFEIHDPRASFITITKVELAKDISAGKIFYSVLGGPAERSKAEHMLDSAAGFIQRQVGRVLALRRMPRLRWVFDESIEKAAELDLLIRQALERDKQIAERGVAPPDESEWKEEYEQFAEGGAPPPPRPEDEP